MSIVKHNKIKLESENIPDCKLNLNSHFLTEYINFFFFLVERNTKLFSKNPNATGTSQLREKAREEAYGKGGVERSMGPLGTAVSQVTVCVAHEPVWSSAPTTHTSQ